MRERTPSTARVAAFTFGLQVVWGALLGVSLQARSVQIAPNWSVDAFNLLAGWGAATAAITQLAAGYASDRLRARGSRRIEFYIAGTIVASVSLVWFYNAQSFAQIFAAVVCVQIGMNIAIAAYQAAVPDLFTASRMGRASSWLAGLQSLGNACGAVLAGLARGPSAWLGIVAALIVTCAITATHVASFPPRTLARDRLTFDRTFADLFVSRALVFLGFYTLVDYVFFYLRATVGAANARAYASYTVLIVTLAAAVGAAVIARAADKVDRRALASGGAAVLLVAIGMLVGVHTWVAIALIALLAGIGWGAFLTADWALGCTLTAPAQAATTLAVWNLALLVPQVLAPGLASAAMHAFSNALDGPRVTFVLAMVELAAGAAWIWRLPALSE